jgi:DNA topoisomerase-1
MAFKNAVLVTNQNNKITVNNLLDEVSQHLGNTRLVCKKYYVHPGIVKMFEEDKLQAYFQELDHIEKDNRLAGLTQEENILMKLLETF